MENCKCAQNPSELSLMKEVLDKYKNMPGSLITVLQKAQEIYGYLPTDVIYHIASVMKTTPAEVMGVATFYTQFNSSHAVYLALSVMSSLLRLLFF